MKKIGIGMFCVALCLAVALMFPQIGASYLNVDSTNCACHDFSGGAGLHSESGHSSCTVCHVAVPDTPLSSTCVVCHPQGDTGKCPLINIEGHPVSCLDCHDDCAPVDTTTTTSTDDETTTTTTIEEETSTTTTEEVIPSTTTTTKEKKCCLVKIYGEDSDEIAIMRYIRDNVLSKSEEGQQIIKTFYRLSPAIKRAMRRDKELKAEIKEMVDGILEAILEDAE